MNYQGIPNKKRRLYADRSGGIHPLELGMGSAGRFMVANSGTLTVSGHLTVTGTHFKTNSVVLATYNESSAGTAPLAVTLTDGTATFKGDNSADFYYVVVNRS